MNNNYINDLDCEIVEDLIPLYHDKAVSEKTKNAVEKHIKGCASCKAEYTLYLKDLPKCESKSTAGEFQRLMSKKRLKQKIAVLMAVVLAVLVCWGGHYMLFDAPLVTVDDTEVMCVYRYTVKDGEAEKDRFFIATNESSNPRGYTHKIKEKDGKLVLEFNDKRPIIAESYGVGTDSRAIDVVDFSAEGEARYPDVDAFIYNGEEIWSKEKNGNDKLPEYLSYYEKFEGGNLDEFGDSDSISWYTGDEYVEYDHYGEGRTIRWSLDGKLLYDSATEKATDSNQG